MDETKNPGSSLIFKHAHKTRDDLKIKKFFVKKAQILVELLVVLLLKWLRAGASTTMCTILCQIIWFGIRLFCN